MMRTIFLGSLLTLALLPALAQRTYPPSSVLASGAWYKLSVEAEGVYRIDVPFLNSLGMSGTIPSAQIRLFGNGGGLLPEANAGKPAADLQENSIFISDGGDGVLNGSDYILFYARGPHQWIKDSANRRFRHRQNIYSDKAFYYITIGGTGLRVATAATLSASGNTVTSFSERYAHELDTVNFLSSGKEWYGEEFSSSPGRSLSRSFTLPLSDLLPQPATLTTSVVARSVNVPSRFNVNLNGQLVQQLDVNPISTALYDYFAQQTQKTDNAALTGSTATLTINYVQGSFNSQGWLNWFEFFCRRALTLPGGRQLPFRDWNSVGTGNASFAIANADANTRVWDVTDSLHPVLMPATLSGSTLSFVNETSRLHEYVCFSSAFLSPKAVGRVANQDLHNATAKDLLIITAPSLAAEARRLAQFHQQAGLRTLVVTTDEVFNEFSSGTPDPVALRDFAKMYFDRFQSTWANTGKYLLLFGRASFDYKDRIANNTNLVPAWESPGAIDPLDTYTSDDFFGFLEDAEDVNSGVSVNTLDIGIGRVPARNIDEARSFVDKVMDYHSPSAFGPWRNNMNLIADDEDANLHLQDAESLAATTAAAAPELNQQKIYLDAFRQESGSAGGRYPQANAVINSNIYNGTLIWNYSGHGGPLRLAEEVVIDQDIVNNWSNRYRLPLFITATCDFAPYDNPATASLGENLLVRPRTGAIALMTTTRVVFASSNRLLNDNYLRFALPPDATGHYKTLGEAVMAAKNYTYQNSADVANNRKFTLLGDPAMTLAFPAYRVRLTSVNGHDIAAVVADTLSAAESVTAEGEVDDAAGQLLPAFQGTAYLTLFDKPQSITTLANDPTSSPTTFSDQENILFKGKATVQNGRFSFRFKVPKDINYQYGNGKVSLYAQDGVHDGKGFTNRVLIGGISAVAVNDNQGPTIRAYLNDEQFVNGGIANASPILLVKLADSSGINTGGSGVDHDIIATLDGDNHQYFVLNNFFESDLDNYQEGSLRFQLPVLAAGHHELKIKAWDILNNSSEYLLDFTVVNNEELKIGHVLNYPNPFTTHTSFWFEHNYPATDLDVRVDIYTVNGKLIKTISQTINTPGNRSSEVEWDGRDAFGEKIARGVYIYRLRVRANGKTAEKWERLVMLGK